MKNIKEAIRHDLVEAGECFAENFWIPKEVVVNSSLLHMSGCSDIIIENFKGILSYTCCEIIVRGNGIKYRISGNNLLIVYYSSEDMRISGKIKEIKVEI